MKAKELMNPRFEVIADYPSSLYGIGDLIEEHEPDKFHYQNCGDYQYASSQTLEKYPHLFKKLNWWEKRNKEDMPKKLICKAIPNDTEIIEIEEWDMDILVGWRNKKERTCASLYSFNPKYGYFPVD